jgi:hypothetical protein
MQQNKLHTLRLKQQKQASELSQMLLDEHIDDIIEMIEDHCLMTAIDFNESSAKLNGVRGWSSLNEEEWEKLIDQLKQIRILGTPLNVIERYNHSDDEDELILSWGYKN